MEEILPKRCCCCTLRTTCITAVIFLLMTTTWYLILFNSTFNNIALIEEDLSNMILVVQCSTTALNYGAVCFVIYGVLKEIKIAFIPFLVCEIVYTPITFLTWIIMIYVLNIRMTLVAFIVLLLLLRIFSGIFGFIVIIRMWRAMPVPEVAQNPSVSTQTKKPQSTINPYNYILPETPQPPKERMVLPVKTTISPQSSKDTLKTLVLPVRTMPRPTANEVGQDNSKGYLEILPDNNLIKKDSVKEKDIYDYAIP